MMTAIPTKKSPLALAGPYSSELVHAFLSRMYRLENGSMVLSTLQATLVNFSKIRRFPKIHTLSVLLP